MLQGTWQSCGIGWIGTRVSMPSFILLIHAAVTLAMVGLIWFVQIVHYPLFSKVGRSEFKGYEVEHQRRTTWVVAPLMLVELISAIALIWIRPAAVSSWLAWTGIIVIAGVWAMTYWVQVPQHARLAAAYDADTVRRLVSGNWCRTAAWTARGLLVLAMMGQAVSAG